MARRRRVEPEPTPAVTVPDLLEVLDEFADMLFEFIAGAPMPSGKQRHDVVVSNHQTVAGQHLEGLRGMIAMQVAAHADPENFNPLGGFDPGRP